MLSPIATVLLLTVVVVPFTVKFPVTITFPEVVTFAAVISSEDNVPSTVTLLNVTFEVVATACPIETVTSSPETAVVTPVPPETVAVSPFAIPEVPESPASVNPAVTAAEPAAVKRPCASTVKVGIAVVEP